MSQYVNDMWPGSPRKDSPCTSDSGHSSRLSSRSRSRSSSRSSRPHSRRSSRSSGSHSHSHSRPRRSRRSRSRSRSRRRHQRKFRRYSRSYSRSRSGSRGRRYRYRDRRQEWPRRYRQFPSPYRSRSRSRSCGRSHYRRSYYSMTRGRRYYGFGRPGYPEGHGRWRERSRSRSRSRSRTPFHLSEKDRMELLEIAKANAAKALGTTNFDLPASLRTVIKESSQGTAVGSNGTELELSGKQREDGSKSSSEKSSSQRSLAFCSNNSGAKPVQNTAKAAAAETSAGPPKIDRKKSPYGLWIPV